MQKKSTVIVLGITGNWAFAAATVLLGLDQHLKSPFDVIIYHDKLSESDQKVLNQIRRCTFISYAPDIIDPTKFRRVSSMAFSRYECFGLIDEYDHVVWVDADTLIVGDLTDLFSPDQSGFAMFQHDNTPISVSFSAPVEGYDMDVPCFNDGLFVLTKKLGNGVLLKNWCYEHTNTFHDQINSDQAIINLLLQAWKISVSKLDMKFNCHPGLTTQAGVAIIHPWGEGKFWNRYYHPAWDAYYKQWLDLGGTPCPTYRRFRFANRFQGTLLGKAFARLGRIVR